MSYPQRSERSSKQFKSPYSYKKEVGNAYQSKWKAKETALENKLAKMRQDIKELRIVQERMLEDMKDNNLLSIDLGSQDSEDAEEADFSSEEESYQDSQQETSFRKRSGNDSMKQLASKDNKRLKGKSSFAPLERTSNFRGKSEFDEQIAKTENK